MTCKPEDTHYAGCACHEAKHASEIIRLEHELSKKSTLQQAVDIARQTIRDQRAEIGRLVTRLEAARDEIHNANLRADRANRERGATAHDLDQLRTDVRAMFYESEREREANDLDRLCAFHHRKIAFFDRHQELRRPRPSPPS